jgi:hypothetical protein
MRSIYSRSLYAAVTLVITILFLVSISWDELNPILDTSIYIPGLPNGPYSDKLPVLLSISSFASKQAYGYEKAVVMSEVCMDNKRIYSSRHGIPFVLGGDTPQSLKLGMSPRLLKVYWILRLLRRGVRRIIYTDLDSMFIYLSPDIITVTTSMNASIGITPDWRKAAPLRRTRSKRHQYATSTDERDSKRLNTGVMLIQNTPATLRLFETVFQEGLRQPQEVVSDQKLLNKHIWRILPRAEVELIDRVKYNAFPVVSDGRYRDMGLSQGDETKESLIVHFAGKASLS